MCKIGLVILSTISFSKEAVKFKFLTDHPCQSNFALQTEFGAIAEYLSSVDHRVLTCVVMVIIVLLINIGAILYKCIKDYNAKADEAAAKDDAFSKTKPATSGETKI